MAEILTFNQRSNYLNKEEDSAIFSRSDYTQFRARVAGQFPINLGYNLLKNMFSVKKKGHVLEILVILFLLSVVLHH